MQILAVPAPLLQAIHDYLLTRPMREVEGLVLEIRQSKPIEPNENEGK